MISETILGANRPFDARVGKAGVGGFGVGFGRGDESRKRCKRWFRDPTVKAIRRGVFKSVGEFIAAIEEYTAMWNDVPRGKWGLY